MYVWGQPFQFFGSEVLTSLDMIDSFAPKRARQMAALNWLSNPSRPMPHGFSGLVAISIGSHLIFCSIMGNLHPYSLAETKMDSNSNIGLGVGDFPIRVSAYALATCWNALGGYRIVHVAPPNTRPVFRRCAILQICLSYYILRFLPHGSKLMTGISNPVRVIDIIVTATSMICTLSFMESVLDLSKKSLILGQSIGFGIIGILLLSVYPLQLSMQGEEWWTCIQDRYPMQASGMVGYIYIPATVTFSLILFGATLYQRKIISSNEFGIASMGVICICLLSTVLSQEIHIPNVSTQRIYLPCEEPLADSLEGRILKALDFSLYARSILTRFLGIQFDAAEAEEVS